MVIRDDRHSISIVFYTEALDTANTATDGLDCECQFQCLRIDTVQQAPGDTRKKDRSGNNTTEMRRLPYRSRKLERLKYSY